MLQTSKNKKTLSILKKTSCFQELTTQPDILYAQKEKDGQTVFKENLKHNFLLHKHQTTKNKNKRIHQIHQP